MQMLLSCSFLLISLSLSHPSTLSLCQQMVATKFYSGHDEDSSINWAEYAKMTPETLLRTELEFLAALDWKVYVSNEEFFEKVASIEKKLARRQGLARGWFTYMELDSLLPSIQITKSFLHFTFIIGLSYTAFVATIVASVFLVSQLPGSYLNAANRKATLSDAVASLSLQQTTNHTPIASNAINSTENRAHTEYMEMDTDLLDTEIDRLGATKHNATDTKDETAKKDSPTTPGALDWSVIVNSWTTEKMKIDYYTDRFGDTFSNFKPTATATVTHSPLANFTIFKVLQPHAGTFQHYFNAIKMQFV